MTGTSTVGRETPTPDGGRRAPAPPAVASPWAETVARWGGRILEVYAVWLLVALILRPVAHHAERPVAEVLSVTNVPSYPSLFSAVVVGLVASGFLRRRRAALWFVVLVWQLPSALVMLLAIVLDRIDPAAGVLDDVHWTAYAGGLVGLVLVVVLVAARHAFPARIARGAWWTAALVLVLGLAVATGVVWALLQVVPSSLDDQSARLGWALSVSVGLSPHEEPFAIDGGAPGWLALVGGLLAVLVFLRTGPRDAARS
ncbi:MAG: bifunctional lysylphosphatidylglycerol synthetase/lysine--tRNA ligase LysX, partial [Cellulosimicrobium funkei]